MRFIQKFIQSRLLHHSLFWAFSFWVLLHHFKVSAEIQTIDVIYTSVFHVSLLLAVYLNHFYFIPKFLSQNKWLIYGILIGIWVWFCSQLNIWIFDVWIDYIFPDYFFIAYYELKDMLIFTGIYVSLSTLLKLSKNWFSLQQEIKEKRLFEIKNLKSQINPHFLLNSLNSLYALALSNSPKTAQSMLKLSEMMQYTLYESDTEKVALQKELNFMEHYIELQKLRIEENKANINFEVIGEVKNQKIAPLLLIPLVENAFKHGIKGNIEHVFVFINIHIKTQEIMVHIKNNKGEAGDLKLRDYQGVGLKNLKQRLEILYPKQYNLNINETKEVFDVKLSIKDF